MPKRNLPLRSVWDEEHVGSVLKPWHYVKLHHYLIHDRASRGLETPLSDIPYDRWMVSPEAVVALQRDLNMCTSKVVERLDSARGDSTKLLIELQDGHRVETVVMRHFKHATVCVSSQIGCKMGCRFCATGTMGIIGDLTSGEIIEQLMHARAVAKIRNVVFMGMGEPLNNFENVKTAVRFMVDARRFGLSPRQVTVSTVGVLKNMRRLTDELPLVNMALSLHAPSQSVRIKIVPAAAAHHIDALLSAVDYHIARSNSTTATRGQQPTIAETREEEDDDNNGDDDGDNDDDGKRARGGGGGVVVGGGTYNQFRRRMHSSGVMIEYILIKDINDRVDHAHELGRLLGPRSDFVLLNLIPYNPTTVAEDFEPPADDDVQRFFQICSSAPYRIHTRVRGEKGQDIEAACGQLALVKPGEGRSRAVSSVDVEDLRGPGLLGASSGGRKAAAAPFPRAAGKAKAEVEAEPKQWLSMGLWLGLPALALALSAGKR